MSDTEKKHIRSNDRPILLYAADIIAKHPFLTTAVACLLCMSLTSTSKVSGISATVPVLTFAFCGVFGTSCICYKSPTHNKKQLYTVLCIASVLFALSFGRMLIDSNRPQLVVLMSGIAFIIASSIYLYSIKALNTKRLVLLLFILGFLFRFAYIMSVKLPYRQHDLGSIEKMDGHLGYMAYISYNLRLPNTDVRDIYQFYHPPLHHIIAALWARILNIFGMEQKYIWENVQILTLYYSSCCMILSYKIFRRMKLSGTGLVTAMAVICFNPTFFILSGSINNDILSITLILGALYNALCWYESRSLGRIICTALCVGFSMMAKLSGWMAAPAIAFIFIFVFFKDIKNFKKYIVQFSVFLGISIPLGMWWSIRNLIKFDVPFDYVYELSEKSGQYIGNVPVMKRLFDFNPYQLQNVGDQFKFYGGKYNEYNPLIALFKTSAFDELYTVSYYPHVAHWDKILFWSVVIVGLISFFAMIYIWFNDRKMNIIHKIFTAIIYTVYMLFYYRFCLQYPQVCTQNIRYAVPAIVLGAYFFGRMVSDLGKCKKKKFRIPAKITAVCLCTIAGIYCLSSSIFYYITFMS